MIYAAFYYKRKGILKRHDAITLFEIQRKLKIYMQTYKDKTCLIKMELSLSN